jgi:hypothetical protein
VERARVGEVGVASREVEATRGARARHRRTQRVGAACCQQQVVVVVVAVAAAPARAAALLLVVAQRVRAGDDVERAVGLGAAEGGN